MFFTICSMLLSLSVSQSMIIWPSFRLSKSWNTFAKALLDMVSTLTEVTSQFLSAAVSRTFCSTDRPGRQANENMCFCQVYGITEMRKESSGGNCVGTCNRTSAKMMNDQLVFIYWEQSNSVYILLDSMRNKLHAG